MLPLSNRMKLVWANHSRLNTRRVFKYTDEVGFEAMMGRESVRLTSCRTYTNMENKALQDIGDDKNITRITKRVHARDLHPNSGIHRVMGGLKNANLIIGDSTFTESYEFPVICFAYENSSSVYRSLSAGEVKYSKCIEIKDIKAFGRLVCEAFETQRHTRLGFYVLPVIYKDDIIRGTGEPGVTNVESAYEKERSVYSENLECKLLFTAPGNMVGGRLWNGDASSRFSDITVAGIRSLMSEVALPEI